MLNSIVDKYYCMPCWIAVVLGLTSYVVGVFEGNQVKKKRPIDVGPFLLMRRKHMSLIHI